MPFQASNPSNLIILSNWSTVSMGSCLYDKPHPHHQHSDQVASFCNGAILCQSMAASWASAKLIAENPGEVQKMPGFAYHSLWFPGEKDAGEPGSLAGPTVLALGCLVLVAQPDARMGRLQPPIPQVCCGNRCTARHRPRCLTSQNQLSNEGTYL